ncbi:Glutamate synthase [NADPH] small chain [Morganella morganii]|nr:Glutamate synthase [NADPH] small chain [Morganella morganii]
MPGSRREVKNAKEEGVNFRFNCQPSAIETDATGNACGVRVLTTRLGDADSSGRRQIETDDNSAFVIDADAVIIAFGFPAARDAVAGRSQCHTGSAGPDQRPGTGNLSV